MQSKKILVALNHPAHYYLFKHVVLLLSEIGYQVKYIIKDKDVLEKILICENVDYVKTSKKNLKKPNKYALIPKKILDIIIQDINLNNLIKYWKPDLMIGTDISITHIGVLHKIPSFVFNEDDYEINKHFCLASYPFATKIIAPNVCKVGKFENKKIGYNGFQKMAYLHPTYFRSNRDQINEVVGSLQDYFIIRVVSLTAGHDIMAKSTGLNEEILDKLIKELTDKGKIFITTEDELSSKYDKFKINISPNKMHDLMAYASLFIGDSQSMCAEAGLLGIPFIRFNDFVGKISVLDEIENSYRLGYGIPTSQPEKIIEKVRDILSIPDYKNLWKRRRDTLFNEKIDVTCFFVQLINDQIEKGDL